MHAQKVAGRQGPGASGATGAKIRAAAAAAANALFIFLLSNPDGKNCCGPGQTVRAFTAGGKALRREALWNRARREPAAQVPAVKRIVILGRGGAGKSTLAQRLGQLLRTPVTELDSIFWKPGPTPTPDHEWEQIQHRILAEDRWIIDGDLGPYDAHLAMRLTAADTVAILDFPLWRCVWRTLRRSRETREYWHWVYHYRRKSLPAITYATAKHATHADVYTLRNPKQVQRFLDTARP
jgi:predicted kinase